MSKAFHDFEAFYAHFLTVHSDRRVRALHHVGCTLAFVFLGLALLWQSLLCLLLVPVAGFVPALFGHLAFQRHWPVLGHPLWSILGDFRMFFEACTGRLNLKTLQSHRARRSGSCRGPWPETIEPEAKITGDD